MTTKLAKKLVVVTQAAGQFPNVEAQEVALFNPDGTVLTVVQTTAAMVLTGYTIAGAVANVAATDTVNVAFGKLQKAIADHETRIVALEGA